MRGQLIGNRYRIEHRLGEGGMASVYAALDEKLGRRVAIKILHKHLADNPELARRFFQEAHAISKLEHQNILKIFDVSSPDAKIMWIVTELLSGNNLAEYVRALPQNKLNYNVAALMIRELVKALEKAHSEGVVHRDIKPENIFILDSGLLKLMDFGIAKNLKSVAVTQTGTFMGSPHYMSPEQIKGTRIDPRSDLYSIGILFYELVTGKLPFNGSTTHDVILKITQGRYLEPSVHEPGLPGDLVKIICKLMSKNRVSRYQKVANLAMDLDQYFSNLGLSESHIELERYFSDPDSFELRLKDVMQSIKIRENLGLPARPKMASREFAKAEASYTTSIEKNRAPQRLENNKKLARDNDRALNNPVPVSPSQKRSLAPIQGRIAQQGSHGNQPSVQHQQIGGNHRSEREERPPLRRDRKVPKDLSRVHPTWSGPVVGKNTERAGRRNTPPVGIHKIKIARGNRMIPRPERVGRDVLVFARSRSLSRRHPLIRLLSALSIGVLLLLMLVGSYLLTSFLLQNPEWIRSQNSQQKISATSENQKSHSSFKPNITLTPNKSEKTTAKAEVVPNITVPDNEKQALSPVKVSEPHTKPKQTERTRKDKNKNKKTTSSLNTPIAVPQRLTTEPTTGDLRNTLASRTLSPSEEKSIVDTKPRLEKSLPQPNTGGAQAGPNTAKTQDQNPLKESEPERPAALITGPGQIRLKAQPACEIYINGILKGTSVDETYSSSWIRLTAGEYQLELRRAGYKSIKKKIKVKAGEKRDLGSFSLELEGAR